MDIGYVANTTTATYDVYLYTAASNYVSFDLDVGASGAQSTQNVLLYDPSTTPAATTAPGTFTSLTAGCQMYINGSNVGIGTANPQSLLQVTNSAVSTSYNTPTFMVSDGAADAGTTYGMINLTRPSNVTDNKGHIAFIRNGSTVQMIGYLQNSNTCAWVASNTMNTATGIFMTSVGYVGIGKTNPAYSLDVSNGLQLVGPSLSTALSDNVFLNVTASDSYNGDGSKNVYSNSISLRGGDLVWGGPTRVYGAQIYIGGGYSLSGGNQNPGNINFYTNNAVRMQIAGNGYVGIGTANPAYPLTVYGSGGGYSPGGSNPYIISPTISVLNTSSYGAVTGWFRYDLIAGGAVGTFSDIRIKNNIAPATNLLDKINQITIVSHGFIDPLKTPSETSIAVIAQDVIKVIPDAVRLNTEVIPNIMQIPLHCVLNDNMVRITCANPMDIEVNNKVQLILASSNKECIVHYVSADRKIIDVPAWDTINLQTDQVFVYGKYVDDFHIVDKSKLGLLALGGVKELHQLIKDQQTQINQLMQRLAAAGIA